MNEKTKTILFWIMVIAIIVIAGLACQYVLTAIPPPHEVVVSGRSLITTNLTESMGV